MSTANPKLNDLKEGDYVRVRCIEEYAFGIVTRTEKKARGAEEDGIIFTHFEIGFPVNDETSLQSGRVRKVAKAEFDNHLNELVAEYEKKIVGGLDGAIAARRQHYLLEVQEYLTQHGSRLITLFRTEGTNTGVYVLMGLYSGQGPSEFLEGLRINHNLPEYLVSKLMYSLFPDGFDAIPGEVRNTRATSHGDLVGYSVFEVPKKALHLVKNPKDLEIRCKF